MELRQKSLKRITLPILIGSKGMKIDVEVVDNDIPLLISKAAMKTDGYEIRFWKRHGDIEEWSGSEADVYIY